MSEAQQLDGQMFLYDKPELLSKEAHGNLGITRPARPFGFCEQVRAIPVTLSEMITASRNYPIIFSDEKNPLPMAVVGVIDNANLFVDDAGEWEPHSYVPGYIRRYPFALAGDGQSDRMALILDRGYEGINGAAEMSFFDGDKLSAATSQAMEFCSNYEKDKGQTMGFAQELAKYDLISNQMAQYTPENGEARPFAQYFAIEEERLKNLSDKAFNELRQKNMLPLVYAQLMSMANWRLLLDRRILRHDLKPEQYLEPLSVQ